MKTKFELRHVEVVVRVRPLTEQKNKINETAQNLELTSEYSDSKKCRTHQSGNTNTACVTIDNLSHAIHLCDVGQTYFVPHRKTYLPDQVFDPSCTNEVLFNELVLPKLKVLVDPMSNSSECHTPLPERQTWEYYAQNAKIEAYSSHDTLCFLAYGHTNSGKTHSIVGEDDNGDDGLLTQTVMYMLNECTNARVRVAMLEVYMERVYDLLANGVERRVRRVAELSSHIDGKNGKFNKTDENGSALNTTSLRVIVEGLSTITISSLQQWKAVSAFGMHSRRTTSTERNERSSRSHALFIVQSLESNMRVCFVDLAGSERQNSFSTQLNKESIFINKSLSQLSTVLRALSSQRVFANGKRSYVNFRGSTLTVLLERYLRGVSRTTFLACIHPSPSFYKETLNTLRYSHRLKLIRTVKLCNMHVANRKWKKLHLVTTNNSRHGADSNNISIGDKNDFNRDDDNNYNENSFYAEYANYNMANVETSVFYEDTTIQKDCDVGKCNSILPTIIELIKVNKVVNEDCSKEKHNSSDKKKKSTSGQKQTSTCENLDNKEERLPLSIRPFCEVETASSTHNCLMQNDNEVDVYPIVNRASSESGHASSAQTQEHEISRFTVNFDDRFDNFLPSSLQVIGYVTNKLINMPTQMFTHCEDLPELSCNDCNTNDRSIISKGGNNFTNNRFFNTNIDNQNQKFNTKEDQFIDTMLENKIENREHTLIDNINHYSKLESKDHHAREFAILPVQNAFNSLTLLTTGIKSSVSLYSSVNCIMQPTCVYKWNYEKIKSRAYRKYNEFMEKSSEQLDVDNEIDGYNNASGNTDGITVSIDDHTEEYEQEQKMNYQCRNTNKLNHVQKSETASCKYEDEQYKMSSQSNNREFKHIKGQKEKEVCSECVFALALFDSNYNNIDDNNNNNNHKTYTETSNKCNHMSSTRVDKRNCTRLSYMVNDTIFPFAIVFAVKSNSSAELKEYVLEWLIHLGSETFCNKATQVKDVSTSITNTCATLSAAATNTTADCINAKTPYDEHNIETMNVVKGNGRLTKNLGHTWRLMEFEVNTYGSENCKNDVVPNGYYKLEASVSESILSDTKEEVFNKSKNSQESVDAKEYHKTQESSEEEMLSKERNETESMLDVNFFHDNSKEHREKLALLIHGREQESYNDMYKRCKEACTVTDLTVVQENQKTANMQVESIESQIAENMRENNNFEVVNSKANKNEEETTFKEVKPTIIHIDHDKSHDDHNTKVENTSRKSLVEFLLGEKEMLCKREEKEEESRCTAERRKEVEEFTCISSECNKNQNNTDQMKSSKTNISEHMNGSNNYDNEGRKIERKQESPSINVHKRRTKRRKYVKAMVELNHSENKKKDNDLQEVRLYPYKHKSSNDWKKKDGDENSEVIVRNTIASPMDITSMYQSSDNSMKTQKYREGVTQFNKVTLNNLQDSSNIVVREESKENRANTNVKISNTTYMKHQEKFLSGEKNSNTLQPSEHKAESNVHRKEVIFERCQACTLC